MKYEEAFTTVEQSLKQVLDSDLEINEDMQLLGEASVLDSMNLVELCLALEDEASKLGFKFDWTSSTAMSKTKSFFRNVKALAEEFANQSKSQ